VRAAEGRSGRGVAPKFTCRSTVSMNYFGSCQGDVKDVWAPLAIELNRQASRSDAHATVRALTRLGYKRVERGEIALLAH